MTLTALPYTSPSSEGEVGERSEPGGGAVRPADMQDDG